MKNTIQKSVLALLAAFTLLTMASETRAGVSPYQLYSPVKSMKHAEALKPGTQIAVSCGNCGSVAMLTVDTQRSYLHGFTCPACKAVFVPQGGGRAAGSGAGRVIYVNDAKKQAFLLSGKN